MATSLKKLKDLFTSLILKSAMESQASEIILPPSAQDYFTAKCRKFDPLWVQVLINLRMKHSKMFTRRRNSASEGWKLVFDELKESGAPEYVTIMKIKKKWMNLMTRYRMNSCCTTAKSRSSFKPGCTLDLQIRKSLRYHFVMYRRPSFRVGMSMTNSPPGEVAGTSVGGYSQILTYLQIKNTTLNPEMITWPYYEQMDRAFGRESETNSFGKNPDQSLNQAVSCDERQSFMKKLIELRYTHRHLFTGRKYTARDGWMIIQSLLQCQGKYSVDQLSKCWQNLVQRYKQLAKSESSQHITWPYFEHMHKWFEENRVSDTMKLETDETENVIEPEDTIEDVSDTHVEHPVPGVRKNNISIECIKIQLLTEIKVTHEKNHAAVMDALKSISDQLNRLSRNEMEIDPVEMTNKEDD